MSEPEHPISAWFTGPKSENGERLAETIHWILNDHLYWRRNYYPEDGLVVTSEQRRKQDQWNDLFNDQMSELLAALKGDFQFARELHMQLSPMMSAIFREGNPAGIKAAMACRSLMGSTVRLPLVPASSGLTDHILSLIHI